MNWMTILAAAACLSNLQTAVLDPGGQEYGKINVVYEEEGSPVCGAEFTFYKVGTIHFSVLDGAVSDQISMIINGINADAIHGNAEDYVELVQTAYEEDLIDQGAEYSGVTDENGRICIENAETGIYLAAETSPAENHVSSGAFFFQLPYTEEQSGMESWNYEAYILPKSVPTGSLRIEKQVFGDEGEYDREFHISVQLDDAGNHRYTYQKSDGNTGICSSGDTFLLKNKDWVLITGIPDGTGYSVSEEEADQNGYVTYISGSSGHIERYETMCTVVKNSRSRLPLTSDTENLQAYETVLILNVILAAIVLSVLRMTS